MSEFNSKLPIDGGSRPSLGETGSSDQKEKKTSEADQEIQNLRDNRFDAEGHHQTRAEPNPVKQRSWSQHSPTPKETVDPPTLPTAREITADIDGYHSSLPNTAPEPTASGEEEASGYIDTLEGLPPAAQKEVTEKAPPELKQSIEDTDGYSDSLPPLPADLEIKTSPKPSLPSQTSGTNRSLPELQQSIEDTDGYSDTLPPPPADLEIKTSPKPSLPSQTSGTNRSLKVPQPRLSSSPLLHTKQPALHSEKRSASVGALPKTFAFIDDEKAIPTTPILATSPAYQKWVQQVRSGLHGETTYCEEIKLTREMTNRKTRAAKPVVNKELLTLEKAELKRLNLEEWPPAVPLSEDELPLTLPAEINTPQKARKYVAGRLLQAVGYSANADIRLLFSKWNQLQTTENISKFIDFEKTSGGCGGAYRVRVNCQQAGEVKDQSKETPVYIGILKNLNEDVGEIDNRGKQAFIGRDSKFPRKNVFRSCARGESCQKEALAYRLAELWGHEDVVPPTSLCFIESDKFHTLLVSDPEYAQLSPDQQRRVNERLGTPEKERLCSIQEFYEGAECLEDYFATLSQQGKGLINVDIDVRSCEKALSQIRLRQDQDTNLGNIIVIPGEPRPHVAVIDAGFSFPMSHSGGINALMTLPFAHEPVSISYIQDTLKQTEPEVVKETTKLMRQYGLGNTEMRVARENQQINRSLAELALKKKGRVTHIEWEYRLRIFGEAMDGNVAAGMERQEAFEKAKDQALKPLTQEDITKGVNEARKKYQVKRTGKGSQLTKPGGIFLPGIAGHRSINQVARLQKFRTLTTSPHLLPQFYHGTPPSTTERVLRQFICEHSTMERATSDMSLKDLFYEKNTLVMQGHLNESRYPELESIKNIQTVISNEFIKDNLASFGPLEQNLRFCLMWIEGRESALADYTPKELIKKAQNLLNQELDIPIDIQKELNTPYARTSLIFTSSPSEEIAKERTQTKKRE